MEIKLPISYEKPAKAKIKKAIMRLRNGKAARPDGIPAETIKADIETTTSVLYSLLDR